jgi:hypothetical protein
VLRGDLVRFVNGAAGLVAQFDVAGAQKVLT